MLKVFKKFVKFLAYVGLVLLFLGMIISAALKFYENDIKQYAVSQLDQYLNTAVYIQDIELSVWKSFPNASLDFKNVLIYGAYPDRIEKDTFFSSRSLNMEFNLQDLWDGNYSVQEINAKDAALCIKLDKNGAGNFNILVKKKDTIKSNIDFDLEQVNFDGLRFSYENLKLDQKYTADVHHLDLNANFHTDSFTIGSKADLRINGIRNKAITFIKNKDALFQLDLTVNHLDTSYTIKNGYFELEKMPFNINGYFDNEVIDFYAKGENITLDKLMRSVNKSISGDIYNYSSKGTLDFDFKVFGSPKEKSIPSVTANFKIKDGSITEPTQNLTIKNIQLKGKYSNEKGSKKEFLEIEKLSAATLDGKVNGSLKIVDFSQPILHTNLNGNANLATLHNFFHFQGLKSITGNVDLYSKMTVAINDPKYAPERFKIKQNKGSLTLKNVFIEPEGNNYFYKEINGKLVFQGSDAAVKDISLKIKNSDITLNGSIKNLVQYLDDQGKLNIIADVESNYLNTDDLLLPKAPTQPSTSRLLPSNINLNLDLDIKKLKLGEHDFNKIHSKIKLLDQKLVVSHIYVEHAGGNLSGNLTFNSRNLKRATIDADLRLSKIKIKELFKEWKNFDQKNITSEHIDGTANVNLNVFAVLDERNELIKDQLVAETKFTINNGSLKKVPMMKTIASAMRDNKMVKLFLKNHLDAFEEKLMNLKFDTLSNTIFVKKGMVTMPKMRVASNALDMNVSAEHSFDNKINYHFDFLFNDLKSTQEYTEFGKVEADGTGFRIFLHMYGNLDNPEFGWDKEGKKQARKENMEAEKQTIKSMLKQEFGFFKNDSTVNGYKTTPKKEEEIIFYDGEFEQKDEPVFIEENSKKKRDKKNKKRNNKFLQKLEDQQRKDKESESGTFVIGD